jgi:hypothetical protein
MNHCGKNVVTRILKEVYHFKFLGCFLRIDGYYTREININISIVKEAFIRTISLLTSELKIELRKKLFRRYVWRIANYGSET